VEEYFPDEKLAIIFGASEDKDIAGMFAELLPLASGLVLYQADHPRAASSEDLHALLGTFEGDVQVSEKAGDAFSAASEMAGDAGVVLVTGSLYLVGELRRELA
jgi:dihydrofolate synthase/folylpolyglutamate synthase